MIQRIRIGLVTLFCFGLLSTAPAAQDYMIGNGDVLSVTFWQDAELNLQATIGEDGTLQLPVGGTIRAAGLTVDQLAAAIVERISLYNQRITHATVKVVEYGSRTVYLMGSIRNPGKFSFEIIPNLWQIISEAGGPLDNANLNNVIIIRGGKQGEPQTTQVDLASILRNQTFDQLPVIEPGDNIYVPAVVGNVPSSGMESIQAQQNVLFIYGEVLHPGVISFNKELNILEALVTAGGPSAQAKLDEVRVIRKKGAISNVTRVDVARYADEGSPAFFIVQGGDTIFVPRKKLIRESVVWDFFMIFTGTALTAFVYTLIR
ncbi:polysaccharide export protein [bacterium]|nr:polysaccharide export protein [bacterium]